MATPLFPAWTDRIRPLVAVVLLGAPLYAIGMLYYGGTPGAYRVGYAPEQPVPFSHATHAGKLGLDCRYCHTTVETAAAAAIPPTATCMNCHTQLLADSAKLAPVVESDRTGEPIPWIRVHDVPDYVYFDHSAHVSRGVSCVSCHGRIDRMERVSQVEPLSMAWCLDCHRNPEEHLRPAELVTSLGWQPEGSPHELGQQIREQNNINPSTDCSTCHR